MHQTYGKGSEDGVRVNSATHVPGQHGDGQEDGQADGVGEEVEAVAEMRLPDLRGEMGTGPGGPRKDVWCSTASCNRDSC